MSKDCTKQEIEEMAKLCLLFGRINEIQEENLKKFPFVFFDGVKTVQIEYDLNCMVVDGSNRHITYHLKINEDNTLLDKRLTALEVAVRNLFWTDLKVKIFINDKLAFESKDGQPASKST